VAPEIIGSALHEFRRYLVRPACPRCGDTLMAAAGAELAARGYIRNSWMCDSCGLVFVTAVRLSAGTGLEEDADEL
jgi:ribosomal protein S27AE